MTAWEPILEPREASSACAARCICAGCSINALQSAPLERACCTTCWMHPLCTWFDAVGCTMCPVAPAPPSRCSGALREVGWDHSRRISERIQGWTQVQWPYPSCQPPAGGVPTAQAPAPAHAQIASARPFAEGEAHKVFLIRGSETNSTRPISG